MAIKKIRSNTIYTVIGNALILFVIGLLLLSLFIGQHLINNLQEQFSFQLELKDGLLESDIVQIRQQIVQLAYVDPSSIQFQSKEEIAEQFINDLDIETNTELVAASLFDAIILKINDERVNSADIIRIKRELLQIPLVVGVNHVEDMSKGLFDNMERLRLLGFVLSLILSLVLIVLIYNNTRLAIYAERFKIRKMQLIGAIPWFITRPFVRTAAGIGTSSALVALLFLSCFLMIANSSLINLDFVEMALNLLKIGMILLFISITISIVSSYVIVNRYLRMDLDDLYT